MLDFVEHTLEGARNKGGGEATLSPEDTLVISSALKASSLVIISKDRQLFSKNQQKEVFS